MTQEMAKDDGYTEAQEEGYPEGWRHCTLHISPDGKTIHSDGDHSVRHQFESMQQGIAQYKLLIKELVKLNTTLIDIIPPDLPIVRPCEECDGTGIADKISNSGGKVICQSCPKCNGKGKEEEKCQ